MPTFDPEEGAETLTLFGLTVRSINADLGLGSSRSVVTVTCIQEPGQEFELAKVITPNSGIREVATLRIGEFTFVGTVQSWEYTAVSPQGSGLYDIKMYDATSVLNDSQIVSCAGDMWGEEEDPHAPIANQRTVYTGGGIGGWLTNAPTDPNGNAYTPDQWAGVLDAVRNGTPLPAGAGGSSTGPRAVDPTDSQAISRPGLPMPYPGNIVPVRPETVEDCQAGDIRFNPVQQAINDTLLTYGSDAFTIDMSEVEALIASRVVSNDDPDSEFTVSGSSSLSISQYLKRLSDRYIFDWYVESLQDVETGINVIIIRVIDRLAGIPDEALDMDSLSALHEDKVRVKKIGFENREGAPAIIVYQGGERHVLHEFNANDNIEQFWGWQPGSHEGEDINADTTGGSLVNFGVRGYFDLETYRGGGSPGAVLPPGNFVPNGFDTWEEWEEDTGAILLLYNNVARRYWIPRRKFDTPHFHVPRDPWDQFRETNEEEMRRALAGLSNIDMDAETLNALKEYAKAYWGKKFIIETPPGWRDVDGYSWVKLIPDAWWENDIFPDAVDINRNQEFFNELRLDDGKWISFAKLPTPETVDGGTGTRYYTDENGIGQKEQVNITYTWDTIMNRSTNIVRNTDPTTGEDSLYMKVFVENYDGRLIVTFPDPMQVLRNLGGKTRLSSTDNMKIWVAIRNPVNFYGPWSTVDGVDPELHPVGRTEIRIDKQLVPWSYGTRNSIHTDAMARLNHEAYANLELALQGVGKFEIGQLEAAGLPKVNIGAPFGSTNINQMNISIGIDGVTTRYTARVFESKASPPPSPELLEFLDDISDKNDPPRTGGELGGGGTSGGSGSGGHPGGGSGASGPADTNDPDDEGDATDPSDEPPGDPDDEEDPDAPGPTEQNEEDDQFHVQRPEGGLGKVIGKSSGPFYTVNRLNIRDIDPSSFGGGLNIDESWFLAEWTNTRNLSEPATSPGYVPNGTIVTVSIFTETPGIWTPYFEQTPPTFAPPTAT
jgi:hypothetical protein